MFCALCSLGFGFAWEGAMALITDRGLSALEALWVGAAWGLLFFLTSAALGRFRRRSRT
jgi:hypothetical protein